MKIGIAQMNPTVGDIEGNVRIVSDVIDSSVNKDVDLAVFSELFISGYPPLDLLEKSWFIDQVNHGIESICSISKRNPSLGILFGAPLRVECKAGKHLANSAILILDGQIRFIQHKSLLPTYDVFDESRYFDSWRNKNVIEFKSEYLGITICEDAWNVPELGFNRLYDYDPVGDLASQGATLFINLSASPFHAGKELTRLHIMQHHAKKHGRPVVFVNQTGGNDELIFDGCSMALDGSGNPICILPGFRSEFRIVDTHQPGDIHPMMPRDPIETIHDALVMGITDYLRRCSFSKAVVGLSGGIDSAVTCALAVRAIGSQNVMGVTMPGPFSSKGSVDDSRQLARNLGVTLHEVPITSIYNQYLSELGVIFKGCPMDATEENIQARIRGNILMAVSNKYGHIVLTTGNKSELAVGYCTLYGDMSGGLAVISDVPKTMIYQLARYINRVEEIIPAATIEKPPSAELRPNQVDQDTLPPYEILDEIIRLYLDEDSSQEEIIHHGFAPDVVRWVLKTINRNEYKRKQAAPGLKITPKAFGRGRRMPIAGVVNPIEV